MLNQPTVGLPGMAYPALTIPGWNVRVATEHDDENLYQALVAFYEDNPVAGEYTPERVRAQIRKGTSGASEWGGMIGVIDAPDGSLAGTIGIFPNAFWYSDKSALFELWLFVYPQYRNLDLHDKLADFAKAYRDAIREQLGYKIELMISVASLVRLEAKIRLFSRWGRQIGAFFLVED